MLRYDHQKGRVVGKCIISAQALFTAYLTSLPIFFFAMRTPAACGIGYAQPLSCWPLAVQGLMQ